MKRRFRARGRHQYSTNACRRRTVRPQPASIGSRWFQRVGLAPARLSVFGPTRSHPGCWVLVVGRVMHAHAVLRLFVSGVCACVLT